MMKRFLLICSFLITLFSCRKDHVPEPHVDPSPASPVNPTTADTDFRQQFLGDYSADYSYSYTFDTIHTQYSFHDTVTITYDTTPNYIVMTYHNHPSYSHTEGLPQSNSDPHEIHVSTFSVLSGIDYSKTFSAIGTPHYDISNTTYQTMWMQNPVSRHEAGTHL